MKHVLIICLFVIFVLTILFAWIRLALVMRRKEKEESFHFTNWIQLLQLLVTLVAAIAAGAGAYYTFFTPFSPSIEPGPYVWRVRPLSSLNPPIEVAFWFSASNKGAQSGVIKDMVATISFPKGKWILSPMFFIKSDEYLKAITKQSDSPDLPLSEPFSPLYLTGNSQVSKCILFMPFEGKGDRSLIEPGIFFITFYAQNKNESFYILTKRKIVIEKDIVEKWRKGTTIVGAHFERDKPVETLLPEIYRQIKE